jgi:purine-nucleoside phosphorylase
MNASLAIQIRRTTVSSISQTDKTGSAKTGEIIHSCTHIFYSSTTKLVSTIKHTDILTTVKMNTVAFWTNTFGLFHNRNKETIRKN